MKDELVPQGPINSQFSRLALDFLSEANWGHGTLDFVLCFVELLTCRRQKQGGLRGRRQHLAGGVATNVDSRDITRYFP